MASRDAVGRMRAEATARVAQATATLADRYGIDVPSALLTPPNKDPDLGRIRQLEAFADVLEGTVKATTKASKADAKRIAELEAELAAAKATTP